MHKNASALTLTLFYVYCSLRDMLLLLLLLPSQPFTNSEWKKSKPDESLSFKEFHKSWSQVSQSVPPRVRL